MSGIVVTVLLILVSAFTWNVTFKYYESKGKVKTLNEFFIFVEKEECRHVYVSSGCGMHAIATDSGYRFTYVSILTMNSRGEVCRYYEEVGRADVENTKHFLHIEENLKKRFKKICKIVEKTLGGSNIYIDLQDKIS